MTFIKPIIAGTKNAKLNIGPGDGLATLDYPFFDGTVCCALSGNNKLYLLTCSHVMTKGNYMNYGGYLSQGSPVIEQPTPTPLGLWSYALLDDQFDIALVDPSPAQAAQIVPATGFNQPRIVDNNDVTQQTAVTMLGYKSGTQQGIVLGIGVSATFPYIGQSMELTNLITVGNSLPDNSFQPISQPGDSGGIVYDNNGFALGMVMGCDDQFTYVIPIQNILDKLSMTIY